jgi:hypothetical protein
MNTILGFAAAVEIGTGLFLMIDPARVVELLLGTNESGEAMPIGRVAGIALLGLGLACWPLRQRPESKSPALWGMLAYNGLVAIYLTFLGLVDHIGGPLLWPGVALHAAMALLLVWTWLNTSRS